MCLNSPPKGDLSCYNLCPIKWKASIVQDHHLLLFLRIKKNKKMAQKNSSFSILAFTLIFILMNIFAGSAFATGRGISSTKTVVDDNKSNKKLEPELFFHDHNHHYFHDGTVLVPGLGRYYVFPRHATPFNPFNYNPVTGNSGSGSGIPLPGTTGGSRSYVPGGDDTFVPNPGVEVPNPIGGGSSTSPPVERP